MRNSGFATEATFRQQAENISNKKVQEHHIGKKSNAVLQQEFFSLVNQIGNTATVEESNKFARKWNQTIKEILNLKDGELILSSFKQKYSNLGRIPPNEIKIIKEDE